MSGYIKRSMWFAVTLFGWLVLALPVYAASFDCGKAQSKVEKMMCDTPAISKLDDEVGKAYQDALNKANEEQKQLLITEQKHWLKHTRNVCGDETCLKLAYWSRQAGLATFFEPRSPLYEHESDKAEAIKQVLATAPLYLPGGMPVVPNFCTQIFDDLKQMKGIRFVDPVVQTLSYEDPALEPWTKQCRGKPPLHSSYGCDPRISGNIDDFEGAMLDAGCSKGFGLPPFKIYELPVAGVAGKKQRIFYSDDAYGGNVWVYDDIFKDVWELRKPRLGGGGLAGFRAFDVSSCKSDKEFFADAGQGGRNGKNYNSIIEYKNQYYFLVLHEQRYVGSDGSFSRWGLDVSTVISNRSQKNQSCYWVSALKPDISNEESK